MNPEIKKIERLDPKESLAEIAAEEKLARLMAEDFIDFAIRFVNVDEYEELVKEGRFKGGEAYSPKIKAGDNPDATFTFREYLKQCKQKTWQEVISEEIDWPQGSPR